MVKVEYAQVPGVEHSGDRILVGADMVVVLDGSSPFRPVDVPVGVYVDVLGAHLMRYLDGRDSDLTLALGQAIENTAREIGMSPGASPSSTVSIARIMPTGVDLLVLGDSPVFLGVDGRVRTITDDRLARLQLPHSGQYRKALAAGHGYTATHGELLAELQREQARYRNINHGHWIAETDPRAAEHAYTYSFDKALIDWIVIATDGAADLLGHLRLDNWQTISTLTSPELADLLTRCYDWEERDDPTGRLLPRAKRHDDKTIAGIR